VGRRPATRRETTETLANSLNQAMRDYETLRKVPLPNHVPLTSLSSRPVAAAGRRAHRGTIEATAQAAPKKPSPPTTSPSCRSPRWRRWSAAGRCRRSN